MITCEVWRQLIQVKAPTATPNNCTVNCSNVIFLLLFLLVCVFCCRWIFLFFFFFLVLFEVNHVVSGALVGLCSVIVDFTAYLHIFYWQSFKNLIGFNYITWPFSVLLISEPRWHIKGSLNFLSNKSPSAQVWPLARSFFSSLAEVSSSSTAYVSEQHRFWFRLNLCCWHVL